MIPPPMPDHWFQRYLAHCVPPGDSPLYPRAERLARWRASMREVAKRQWDEAVLAGLIEGTREGIKVRPVRMEITCDQQSCRLADLVRKD